MDKILLKNLGFYGYHGVLKEENVIGQKFFVDITLYTALKKAGVSDDVHDTINYALVYDIAKEIVENKRYNLIEAVAEDIAASVLKEFNGVKEIKVRIRKPEAPVAGIYDYFGVEIRRGRND